MYSVKSMYEVMGSMKTNEELVAASAMPTRTNITTSCKPQQRTQPVVVQYLQEQMESALVHEQAAVQVMGSTPSFYPVLGHSSSVVTQSTRAPSFTSQSIQEHPLPRSPAVVKSHIVLKIKCIPISRTTTNGIIMLLQVLPR